MPAAAKLKTELRIVGPDLTEMERVLTEAASQMAPILSRVGSRRAHMEAALKEREAELQGHEARRDLVERHFRALEQSMNAERADIEGDIRMLRNALLDGAEQERTVS